MPIERRIREGTERNAGVLDPDVGRFLGSVVHKARRRVVIRRSLTAAASIAVVAAVAVAGPSVLDDIRGSNGIAPGSTPTSSAVPITVPPVASLLTGTFTRSIAEGSAVVRNNGLAGTWTIDAANDGSARLVAPGSFPGAHASASFEVHPDTLRSAAFGSDICSGLPAGSYHWSAQSGFLVLTAISDPCDARVIVLAAGPWAIHS
jgi:hypothetical protein